MDQVTNFLQDLCQMDRFGGRCVRVGHDVWEICDVANWTEDHVSQLHRRFPSMTHRVTACRKSLSGYCIVLERQQSSHTWSSVMVAGVMVAIMGAVAAAC